MFKLMQLPYDYSALEPHIDAKTVEIHYSKHHAGYVAKLNAALENIPELLQKPLEELLQSIDSLPAELQKPVFNNGCQVYNHNQYWESLSPQGGGVSTGDLGEVITQTFGSFEEFQSQFSQAGATQFGSGWVWLVVDSAGKLSIEATSNADTPLVHGKTPILTMDVWEHAYYLNYQNRRPDYITAFWNVVNWDAVATKFAAAR